MSIVPALEPNSGYQYVPVPNMHVPAVLAYLAGLLTPAEIPGANDAPAPSATLRDSEVDWTDADLQRLAEMKTKTSGTVSAMLDFLSRQPGRSAAMTTSALAEALGIKYHVLKNVPTQVTRSFRTHFPGLGFPCSSDWDNGSMIFWVTPERAAQWKRLRG